jgi:hypothetical protein
MGTRWKGGQLWLTTFHRDVFRNRSRQIGPSDSSTPMTMDTFLPMTSVARQT